LFIGLMFLVLALVPLLVAAAAVIVGLAHLVAALAHRPRTPQPAAAHTRRQPPLKLHAERR
jgi:hypothetical protein